MAGTSNHFAPRRTDPWAEVRGPRPCSYSTWRISGHGKGQAQAAQELRSWAPGSLTGLIQEVCKSIHQRRFPKAALRQCAAHQSTGQPTGNTGHPSAGHPTSFSPRAPSLNPNRGVKQVWVRAWGSDRGGATRQKCVLLSTDLILACG